MPKLGKWGALAGAGAGVMDNARRQLDSQEADRRGNIDEAREMRLAEFKSKLEAESTARAQENELARIRARGDVQGELQSQLGDIESEHIDQRGGVQGRLQDDQQDFVSGESLRDRIHRADEGQADRESRERIASMSSTSAAAIEARRRFQFETSTTVDNSSGFPVETDAQILRDVDTGLAFTQQGSRFVLQGEEPRDFGPEVTMSEGEYANWLIENPQYVPSFSRKYNYLPAEVVAALQRN